MVEHGDGVQPDDISESRKGVERPGHSLRLARLISPHDFQHKIAEIIGIPFEESQLQVYSIEVPGHGKIPLLKMMEELGLLGHADGVPHLSRGGALPRIDEEGESYNLVFTSQAARAYLVGGYGIKGMGLVQYDTPTTQVGFGLDTGFQRGERDRTEIGGGLKLSHAEAELKNANDIRLLFLLNSGGDVPFARFFNVLPYQDTFEGYNRIPAGIVIREDGQRGLEKKVLTRAIFQVLPTLTDFFYHTPAFFLGDGHNAFLRGGKVVFTDFEKVDHLVGSPVDFMVELSQEWYFEELRKNYSEFLRMYGLTPTSGLGVRGADLERVKEQIAAFVSIEESRSHGSRLDVIKSALDPRDDKDEPLPVDLILLMRFAMAGVISEHANVRYEARGMLSDKIGEALKDVSPNDPIDVQTLYERILALDFGEDGIEEYDDSGGRYVLTKDQQGRLIVKSRINTFGLPIDPEIAINLTPADIYEESGYRFGKKVKAIDSAPNEFSQLRRNLFSDTAYSRIAGIFARMEHEQRTVLTTSHASSFGDIAEGVFAFSDLVKIECRSGSVTIESPYIENIGTANLNKIAYIVHVTSQYLREKGINGPQNINISIG